MKSQKIEEQNFYWYNMEIDIKLFISKYETCLKLKSEKRSL